MSEVEETAVIVVAGSWECSDRGIWDFVIAKECFARTIAMSMSMSYEDFIAKVTAEFEIPAMNLEPKLSYWLPTQLSIFSVSRRPPVIITTTMGVRNFLTIRRSSVNLNLLLSLQPCSIGDGSIGMRRLCVAAEDERNLFSGDNGGIRMVRIGTSSTGNTGVKERSEDNPVRRNLFGGVCDKGKGVCGVEGGCSKTAMRDYSVGGGLICEPSGVNVLEKPIRELTFDPCIGTDYGGIINLADAATPSLTGDIGCEDEGRVGDVGSASNLEDELALEALEAFEKATESQAKDNGSINGDDRGKCSIDGECEGYITDGVGSEDSEESGLRQFEKWGELSDNEASDDLLVPVMEEGGPSCVREQEDVNVMTSWFDEPRVGLGEDVGEEVLTYVTNSVNIPLSLENFYEACNEQGTLPTRDAEPVFDDVIDLTNTDGCAPVSAEEDAIYIGRVFKDKEEMQNTISIYAIKRLFHFRQTRSDPNRLVFVCVDPSCRWRVFGHVVSPNSKNFEVRTATLTHTCTIVTRAKYAKHASAKVIGSVLARKYANGVRGPRAVDIPDIVLQELKVSVTYMKAWYSKEAAVRKSRGSDERSFELLAGYMYLLKQGNPGTVYKLEYKLGAEGTKKFKYMVFSLGASIAGMKYLRKVVLVDGTTIKAKFKGVLLAASMQDANFQVFPIAFGIVDSENSDAWTWFFRQLSGILPDAEDLVIVSDRHRSIYAGVGEVYPLAFHGACAVHVERNIRHFSGKGLGSLVGKAARAYNVGDFKFWYSEILTRSPKCAAYLDGIPLEHWTQAYCPAKRYNIMSSNIAEALNGALAKIVELPIVTMVESIRTKLMQWFCIRRAKAGKLLGNDDPVTPNVNKLMLRYHKASAGLAVKGVSAWTYEVSTPESKTYYVDLEQKSCTCNQFQKLQIPCCHALAAARINGIFIPSMVGPMYYVNCWLDTYREYVYPVPNHGDAEVPEGVESTQFKPPTNPPGPGRRRKRRIPSTGEIVGQKRRKGAPHKCSICYEEGHNRATCSNPVG